LVARTLYGRLEQIYPPVAMLESPASGCVLLLGGSVSPVFPPRVDIDMSDAVDRVRMAARLQLAGKAGLIIVAAGNQPWDPFAQTEAQATQVLLLEWGVPPEAIVLEGASRNTRENALDSASLLQQHDCATPLLVTSAAHMARSVATFKKAGVEVFPVPADIRVIRNPDLVVFDFLPDAVALKMTTDAMREWTGWWVYRLRGWL
jgi:uncharacterized SAM-binding protein YcdF (DUF218 family)